MIISIYFSAFIQIIKRLALRLTFVLLVFRGLRIEISSKLMMLAGIKFSMVLTMDMFRRYII